MQRSSDGYFMHHFSDSSPNHPVVKNVSTNDMNSLHLEPARYQPKKFIEPSMVLLINHRKKPPIVRNSKTRIGRNSIDISLTQL